MNVEEARETVTRMCMEELEISAELDEETRAAIENGPPTQVKRAANDEGWFRLELRYNPPNWEARIRAILSAPIDGADIELAEALTVVWRAEDARERVPIDLVRAVEEVTGKPVF